MSQSAKNCDECESRKYEYHGKKRGEVFVCKKGHKPRFYMPKSALDSDFGYRRICTDYQLGSHVITIKYNSH